MALLDTMIIGGLVLGWGWVLGKPLVASVLGVVGRNSVGSFHRSLDALSRTSRGTAGPRSPQARRRARQRRRQVFLALVISVVASLPLALVWGGVFTTLHLAMLTLLGVYVGLAAVAARRIQRSRNVLTLRPAAPAAGRTELARAVGGR